MKVQRNFDEVKTKANATFKCNACGEIFSCKRDLNVHMNDKHAVAGAEQFNCETCGKTFNEEWKLKAQITSIIYLRLL